MTVETEREKRLHELSQLGGVLDRQIATAIANGMDLAAIDEHYHQYNVSYDQCTCATCPDVGTCPYAWDLYNTDGDCLGSQ